MPRTRPRRSASALAEFSRASATRLIAASGSLLDQAFHRAQGHANSHQPSLGAVVQVALDPAQFGGGGVDRVDAGRGQASSRAWTAHRCGA